MRVITTPSNVRIQTAPKENNQSFLAEKTQILQQTNDFFEHAVPISW